MTTTDLHMHLTGYDYVADRPGRHHGLAGLAHLVEDARAEAAAEGALCLFCDNGDLLQGNALGARLARTPVDDAHPVVRSVRHLGYDALGLGNHDLDYGLAYPREIARALGVPVISSNLEGGGVSPIRAAAILDRALPGGGGTLRVGLLSVMPGHLSLWNRSLLDADARVTTPLSCLSAAVPRLRAAGADIVILLAHLGIDADTAGQRGDTALALARVAGIDAIVAGHTHRRFPDPAFPATGGVDRLAGTLGGVPTVMAGHNGSDLGLLDLELARTGPGGGWRVLSHRATLRTNPQDTPPHRAVEGAVAGIHEGLRADLAQPLGRLGRDLHGYFALAAPTGTAALSAAVKAAWAQAAIAGRPEAALPLLACASAVGAAGPEGPEGVVSLPAGPFLRRTTGALDPYRNPLCLAVLDGAALRRRLEHAARVYADPVADGTGPLQNDRVPAFNFETIYGLTYRFDLRAPPGRRLRDLCHDGAPIRDGQQFLLAMNLFRAYGGGGYDMVPPSRVLATGPRGPEDAWTAALGGDTLDRWLDTPPWCLDSEGEVRATLRTSPAAASKLDEIAGMAPRLLGIDDDGFARIALRF